jgi:hypothetical protein
MSSFFLMDVLGEIAKSSKFMVYVCATRRIPRTNPVIMFCTKSNIGWPSGAFCISQRVSGGWVLSIWIPRTMLVK